MYANILVALDLDHPGSWDKSLATGIALAHCFSARLALCTVVRNQDAILEAEWSPAGYREMLEIAKAKLETIADTVDGLEVAVDVGAGTISDGIIQVAARLGADLIVLSSHIPELKDYLVGTNASRVVKGAASSVLVVRGSMAQGEDDIPSN